MIFDGETSFIFTVKRLRGLLKIGVAVILIVVVGDENVIVLERSDQIQEYRGKQIDQMLHQRCIF